MPLEVRRRLAQQRGGIERDDAAECAGRMQSSAATIAALWRRWCPTSSGTPVSRTTRSSRSPAATDSASGFSTSTGTPRRSSAAACGTCSAFGVATIAASGSAPCSNASSDTWCAQPLRCANGAASAAGSTNAATRQRGCAATRARCSRPIDPAPMIATAIVMAAPAPHARRRGTGVRCEGRAAARRPACAAPAGRTRARSPRRPPSARS